MNSRFRAEPSQTKINNGGTRSEKDFGLLINKETLRVRVKLPNRLLN